MDYKEEQSQEIEILESIYPDELIKISDVEFKINIKLDVESDNTHFVALHVIYPETYPEVAPDLDVEHGENLTLNDEDELSEEEESSDDEEDEEEENRKLVVIADTIFFNDEDLQKLRNELIEEAEDNIGMPSVFALLSSLKDRAELYFQDLVDKAQKKYDLELLAKEMEEQKKFIGTKVTPESFALWRQKFRTEFGVEEKYRKRFVDIHQGKMTGKEIFEKGLAKDLDEDELAHETEALKI